MISDDLSAMEAKIARELRNRPECFITHLSEVPVLQRLSATELQQFANDHGWRVVRRLGGRQFQFYNSTNERLVDEAAEARRGAA